MKKIIALLCLLTAATLAFAQTVIPAREIIDKINRNMAVSYRNAVIEGTLDFTSLANRKREKNGINDKYVSKVTVPLTFENCRFNGDVLAYISPENGVSAILSGGPDLYTADFTADVSFSGCTFTGASAFKYSHFSGTASFAGSTFEEEALFKYAAFHSAPDFSRTTFKDDAVFKYVSFPGAMFGRAASTRICRKSSCKTLATGATRS